MKTFRFIFFLLMVPFISCRNNQEKWLELAEFYMFNKPDSTFYYLDKIGKPEKLSNQNEVFYNYIYGITNIAHLKNRDFPVEKMERSIQFFIEGNDSSKVSMGLLLLGKFYTILSEYQKSDSILKEGFNYTTDPQRKNSYYRHLAYNAQHSDVEKAIRYGKSALQDTIGLSPYYQAITLGDIGDFFKGAEIPDSALFYYDEALREAYTQQYYNLIAYYHKKKSEQYRTLNNISSAFKELQISMHYDRGKFSLPHYQFIKAQTYLAAGERDSAIIYLQKAIETPNSYIASRAYEYLAYIYNIQERDSLGLETIHLYNDHARQLDQSQHQNHIQYKEDQLKFENSQLLLLKKQRELYLLLLSLLIILLCSISYFIYFREKKRKEQKEAKLKRTLLENQVKQLEQEKEVSLLKEKIGGLREQIFRQLSASHKIPSLSKKNNSTESKVKLTDEELKELVDTVNTIWPGFTERLAKSYPELKTKDTIFCCLIKCGITTKDLSNIYYVTPSAISQKKKRLKKEKFGIPDENIQLETILETL